MNDTHTTVFCSNSLLLQPKKANLCGIAEEVVDVEQVRPPVLVTGSVWVKGQRPHGSAAQVVSERGVEAVHDHVGHCQPEARQPPT